MRLFTIAANTFTEATRAPVYLIIFACGLSLILISPHVTMFAQLENIRMVKDMGLSTILLCGLLLAAFSASTVINREVENKTLLTVISKPVKRSTFILGKYLGLLLSLLVAQSLLTLVLLQIVRTDITEAAYSKTDRPVWIAYLVAMLFSLIMAGYANFFYEKPFTSSAIRFAIPAFTVVFLVLCLVNHKWELQPFADRLDIRIVLAVMLIFLATAVLCAVATAASTRLGPIPNLALCATVFLLGLFSDYLFGQNIASSWIAKICYNIIPNLQIYWVVDAVTGQRDIPLSYFTDILCYTILMVTAMLLFAIALFQEREA